MTRFVISRIAGALVVIGILLSTIFVLQAVVPGDPVRAKVGANASAETVERARQKFGFDEPLTTQYIKYMKAAAVGDLGTSIRTDDPVTEDIKSSFPASMELALAALVLATTGGLLLGILAAGARRGSGLIRLLFVTGGSTPIFLSGLLMLYVFYLQLGWLPGSGRGEGPWVTQLEYLVMPAVSLALLPAVAIGRVLSSSLLSLEEADFVRTARSKGLSPRRVLFKHMMRNALSAPLTMTGLQFGLVLGNLVIVESIFAWPGVGLYLNQSIAATDLPAVAGVSVVLGALYVLANVLVDMAQAVADPRLTL